MICAYIYDAPVMNKNYFKEYLNALDRVLQRLTEVRLKVNAEVYCFGRKETEYIDLWIRNNGVRPLPYKVFAMDSIDLPTKVHDVRKFVGLVNYYINMWCKHAHTLAPRTRLC